MHQRFASAAIDGQAKAMLVIVTLVCLMVAGLMTYTAIGALGDEPAWVPIVSFGVAAASMLIPFGLMSGLPTEYVLDAKTVQIVRRWRPTRAFRHEGRAERFLDGASLKAKNLYGSGRPMFASIISATTDLPGGRLCYALTDRDRCVLVFHHRRQPAR